MHRFTWWLAKTVAEFIVITLVAAFCSWVRKTAFWLWVRNFWLGVRKTVDRKTVATIASVSLFTVLAFSVPGNLGQHANIAEKSVPTGHYSGTASAAARITYDVALNTPVPSIYDLTPVDTTASPQVPGWHEVQPTNHFLNGAFADGTSSRRRVGPPLPLHPAAY